MIDDAATGEIIAQYEKHGWKLRRALLSGAPSESIKFDQSVDVIKSDIDALWFSRQSNPETHAWELRRLSSLPFALIAVVPANASHDELEDALMQVVEDMRERTNA